VTALATGFADVEQDAARLGLEGSSLNDPNFLGMTLLIGLPLWMWVIGDRSRYPLTRLVAGLCTIPILVAIPMTGSRGTLVAALLVMAYLFKRFSIAAKTGLLVVVSFIVILTSTFLASDLLERFSSITDPDQVANTASTESRVYLFKQGLRLIARNPITGVGIGMYVVAENDLAIEQGLNHGTWHTCHNMYMQVASEGGLPAFAVYLMILWTVWKTLGRLEKVDPDEHPRAPEIVRLAFWLRTAVLAFYSCGIFLSVGISQTFIIFTALPMALARVVQGEIEQLEQEKNPTEGAEKPAPAARAGSLAAPVRGLRGEA
jgi:O-antigen ligase